MQSHGTQLRSPNQTGLPGNPTQSETIDTVLSHAAEAAVIFAVRFDVDSGTKSGVLRSITCDN